MEKTNNFFGNLYIGIGWIKGFIGIVTLLQIIGVLLGGGVGVSLETIAGLVGIVQLILCPISVVMIFVSLSHGSSAISGYILGLVSILLEIFLRPFLLIFLIFFIAVLYIKAGLMIKNNGNPTIKTVSDKQIKDTDWFYSDKK